MNPGSLYLQQLKDRMGQQAVDNTNSSNIPAYKDESGSFNDMFAYLSEISINGVKLETFKKEMCIRDRFIRHPHILLYRIR